jgi:lysophospholipase L1-like esterase
MFLVAVAACTTDEPASPKLRVLFIGNSLTEGNDLPHLVQAMAAAGGVKMKVAAVTPGGQGLEDQWNGGVAKTTLTDGKWDFVVLQQGPSSQLASQAHLKKWATKWADLIREQGAQPALYMVWPFQGQQKGFELVAKSYRAAAKAAEAKILPAGEAWQEALSRDPKIVLYQADNLHPTPAGSYLAALVISRGLTGVAPKTVPATLTLSSGKRFSLTEQEAELLRGAAEKVTAE